jgi:hypothetical protein
MVTKLDKTTKSLMGFMLILFVCSSAYVYALTQQYYVESGKLILTLPAPPVEIVEVDTPTPVKPIIPVTLFSDSFSGKTISSNWLIENLTQSVTLYTPFTPPPDHFTVSARVMSTQLAAFALRLNCEEVTEDTPIFGSTNGIQLEMDCGVEDKWFTAAYSNDNWNWTNFTQDPIELNTWYVLEMVVNSNPYSVTFNVYNGDSSALLGTYQQSSIDTPYSNIQYICLETWSGPANYSVDWVKVIQ